ncbi:MAG: hypothetical protein RH917_17305 [Lacipirellulaceae bacterium]
MKKTMSSSSKTLQRITWLFILAVAGCGGTYDSTVTGVVTLDGEPLSRGRVTFYPTSPGPPCIGSINEQGRYEVSTGLEVGLPSGEYAITVVANEPPEKSQGERGGPPPAGKLITPAWYKSKQFSGLKENIEPGANEVELALTSEPPAGWVGPKKRGRR